MQHEQQQAWETCATQHGQRDLRSFDRIWQLRPERKGAGVSGGQRIYPSPTRASSSDREVWPSRQGHGASGSCRSGPPAARTTGRPAAREAALHCQYDVPRPNRPHHTLPCKGRQKESKRRSEAATPACTRTRLVYTTSQKDDLPDSGWRMRIAQGAPSSSDTHLSPVCATTGRGANNHKASCPADVAAVGHSSTHEEACPQSSNSSSSSSSK